MSVLRGLMVLLLAFACCRANAQGEASAISGGFQSGLVELADSADGVPGEEAGNERQPVAVTPSTSAKARPGMAFGTLLTGILLLVASLGGAGRSLLVTVAAGGLGRPGAVPGHGLGLACAAHPATAPPSRS